MGAKVQYLFQLLRIHIVLVAVLGVLTFQAGFRLPIDLAIASICGFDWLLVNLLNRLSDSQEDYANQVVRYRIPKQLSKNGTLGLLLAAIVSLPIGFYLAPAILPWRIAAWTLAILYNYDILGKRLKQRFIVKNIASACGFMLTVFAYPLSPYLFSSLVDPWSVLAVGLFFFLFEVSFEVTYDLRDIVGDTLAGVHTIPVVYGQRWARTVTLSLLGMSAAVLFGGFALQLPLRLFVMIVAPLFQAGYLWHQSGPIRERDCVLLTTICAAMLATYNVWIALQLPFHDY